MQTDVIPAEKWRQAIYSDFGLPGIDGYAPTGFDTNASKPAARTRARSIPPSSCGRWWQRWPHRG